MFTHLRNNWAASWPGIEPATESRKFNIPPTLLMVVMMMMIMMMKKLEVWSGCQEVGSSLSIQALNAVNVPLAVDKCISFISLHGAVFILYALYVDNFTGFRGYCQVTWLKL